jgi:succinyl-CoA synthetase alpha subunit
MLELLDSNTPVLIQGISGRMGRLHTGLMRQYGTNIVAGVSMRGQDGDVDGIPVYPSCSAAQQHRPFASVVMVPPLRVMQAVEDAIDAGIRLIVTVAEGIPVHDALRIRQMTADAGVSWIGPSTPGLCIPGKMKLGFLPDVSIAPGPLGVMSKSGTLSYEVCYRLSQAGVGQSAWVGVGGDPVKGTRFSDMAPELTALSATRALLLIGEVGGDEEEEFAHSLQARGSDIPVYALIAGKQAKEGVSMGHAGALVMGGKGSIVSKHEALKKAGVEVHQTMHELVAAIAGRLGTGPTAHT